MDFSHYGAHLTETGHVWGFLALYRRLLKRSRHFGIPVENEAERVSAVTPAAAEWRPVVAARRISLW